MPLYEYRCNQCGGTFEKLRKFSDPPLALCEVCHGGPVEQLLSTPAFHLKGGGWYQDGYAAAKSGGSSDSKPAESKSSDAKTESKPAAKTEAPSAPTTAPAASKS